MGIAARSGEPGESLARHALRNPPPFKSPDRRVIAECFLAGRIYVVQDEVWRYGNRRGTDPATRDHRLELVRDADVRAGVRQALQGFPEVPCNFPHAQIAVGGTPSPVNLHLSKEAGETRLDTEGGTPPYRILRSESNDFANPTVLEDAWLAKYYVDFGTLTDGRNYRYSVE